MRFIALILSIGLFISASHAAVIRGKVRLRKKGAFPNKNPYVYNGFRTELKFSKWKWMRNFESTRMKDYTDSTDTIIYLSHIPDRYKRKEIPNQEPIPVHINSATFHVNTLPVMTGSTLEFINHDPVPHDIYSFSATKPFETQFFQNRHAFVTFKKPGGVTIRSSVYKNMRTEILVLDHPYFTKPRKDGTYHMRNLRPGVYQISAWHPEFPTITKEVEVNYGETITIDFNMATMGLPKALVK
ncbi:MAG: hypothetical protein KC646_10760 [Candidatus Cloacimonetes bacterium]|nr:hypothetical protein [Candidatus Cloacimonadota bacterium]